MASPHPASNLQRALAELGLVPAFAEEGRFFYNPERVFWGKDLGRDLRRYIDPSEWTMRNSVYYLTERGLVFLAFRRKTGSANPVAQKLMQVLEAPAPPPLPVLPSLQEALYAEYYATQPMAYVPLGYYGM